ncbi:MAG: preprotein translocase subunit SecA [Lentisphaeria bacterium]|nr:preprotein translocase subunit SecA [Lentisphaeria bacterium]
MNIKKVMTLLLGSGNERRLIKLESLVRKINAREIELQGLSDEELRAKTDFFKSQIAAGVSPDKLMIDAYAVVKNACRRLCGQTFSVCGQPLTWNMVPYDVQIMGGIVLHCCGIAEMATGEGKTLVAAMPMYLNALSMKGAHLVTVNDYLALRDSEWIGNIYRFLGLSCACIQQGQSPEERRNAYAADITYGTNAEFGFDYLRDNGMARSPEERVQRGLFFALIDEIDSILIDEARTPLIISGEQEVSLTDYEEIKPRVAGLLREQSKIMAGKLSAIEAKLAKLDELTKPDAQLLQQLFQVRLGMPRHPQLRKMLENSALHEELNKLDSKMRQEGSTLYLQELKEELYFTVDEKQRQVELTGKGYDYLNAGKADLFILPNYEQELARIRNAAELTEHERTARADKFKHDYAIQTEKIHVLTKLLEAYCIFERDVDYVVDEEGKILIVDEHTGRAMPGRRYNDGLHQALEIKEGVKVEDENITYASITLQNYFRLYKKLAGMTGTALTEEEEFAGIYDLTVTAIPTNRPVKREIWPDLVFRTKREKFKALADEVVRIHATGRPILLGTPSVEDSEMLSRILRRQGISHQVLNAKQNRHEAEIIARAGELGAVTVATNMAGRGTDIRLGEGVTELGGLHVLGSSRHDARRIDLQLRGRCGRQGDPGSSQFYVSLEDEFMRLFGPENMVKIFSGKLAGLEGGISHERLDALIDMAQKKLEKQNYYSRKHTLEYDDVMNKHRGVIYSIRNEILDGKGSEHFSAFLARAVEGVFAETFDEYENSEDITLEEKQQLLVEHVADKLHYQLAKSDIDSLGDPGKGRQSEALITRIAVSLNERTEALLEFLPPEQREHLKCQLILRVIDRHWINHLNAMEALQKSVWLSSYEQKQPIVVFYSKSYELFEDMMRKNAFALVESVDDFERQLEEFKRVK